MVLANLLIRQQFQMVSECGRSAVYAALARTQKLRSIYIKIALQEKKGTYMADNVILTKSKRFAIDIVNLYKVIVKKEKEYVLSKQMLRAGTSIGANVKEAQNAQSRADFVSKMSIALKEADETEYWLEPLYETEYISKELFEQTRGKCAEIIRILTSIVKNAK